MRGVEAVERGGFSEGKEGLTAFSSTFYAPAFLKVSRGTFFDKNKP